MSKPDVLIYDILERYTRPDLVAFTRTSPDMHYDRSLWGKSKSIKRISFEEFSLSEDETRKTKNTIVESIVLKDDFARKVDRIHEDKLKLEDDYSRGIVNSHEEIITIKDSVSRNVERKFEERFFIFDQEERKPNTVMYDIEFSDIPLSEEDFDRYHEHSTPIGYSELRPLIPGEYEYKDAVVGVQVTLSDTQGKFGILGSKLVLDVEDVVEKGKVVLTGGSPEVVKFTKKFYTTPQVVANLVESSRVGTVEVSKIDRESFVVGIRSEGEYIEGTIDYLADGY